MAPPDLSAGPCPARPRPRPRPGRSSSRFLANGTWRIPREWETRHASLGQCKEEFLHYVLERARGTGMMLGVLWLVKWGVLCGGCAYNGRSMHTIRWQKITETRIMEYREAMRHFISQILWGTSLGDHICGLEMDEGTYL